MLVYLPLADIKDSKFAGTPLGRMHSNEDCDTEEEAKACISAWTDFYGMELENIRIEVRDREDDYKLIKTIFIS